MSTDAELDTLRRSVDIVAYISQYVQLTKSGAEFRALCPFHADHNPSLTVSATKQIWACFSCFKHETHGADIFGFIQSYFDCTFPEAILKLRRGIGAGDAKPIIRPPLKKKPPRIIEIPPAGDEPDMIHSKLGPPLKTWIIRTRDGRPLMYESRYVALSSPDKETRPWSYGRYSENEPARWESKWPESVRPFWGLEHLGEHPRKVWIWESAGKAEAARELFPGRAHLGLMAGCYAIAKMDLSPLAGRHCVLIPDNDEAGKDAMKRLAILLWAAGAVKVKGINPETQPHPDDPAKDGSESPLKWDIKDAVGWTPEIALAWANARIISYDAPQQIAQDAPEPPPVDADAPPADAIAPPAPAKPALRVVDGNTVRAPRQEIEPEAEQLPAFSEFALAQRFADGPGADWRYTAAWLQWAKWDGIRWVPDECKRITWETKELCKSAMQEHISDSTPSQRLRITTLKTVNAVMGLACAYPEVAVGANAWDADPWLLGTPGGIVDLRTGELVASERRQLISKTTLVASQDGPHPLFDRVLARPGSSAEMLDFLWRWLGYFLTGDVREERFMFLHGVGGSGKGTLIKVIADILGDYGRAIAIQAFTESQHQRHSQEIAKLQGARLVYASETEEGSRFDEAMLKWLTGRDKITAHKMRQDDIEFYPQFKLLIYGNNRPSLKSVGEDMRRRIDLIEFPGSIPEAERDTGLKDKLRAEYPAILASMIRACVRWQAEGLGKPETVAAATENYLKMNDVLGEFIDDWLDISADAYSPSGAAYKRFSAYCSDRGERYVMSHRTFTQRLEARGYPAAKVGGLRIYRGFKIRATGYEPDPGSWQDPDR